MTAVQQMAARILDRKGLEKLARTKADEARETKRAGHELQCARVRLETKTGGDGRRWFRCTGCGYTFHELTEGAAALVRRAGA